MCRLAASGRLPKGLSCSSYLTYVLVYSVYSTLPCSLQTAWQVSVLCQHPGTEKLQLDSSFFANLLEYLTHSQ